MFRLLKAGRGKFSGPRYSVESESPLSRFLYALSSPDNPKRTISILNKVLYDRAAAVDYTSDKRH